ncbi:hypothetical protein HGRIS_004458 [Hohenbuehelia grisea]|uniref:Uncharacterized protein n=1 Tax=Hohenbuehelia grisea TaxID=104357 RepID=A0ABR3JCP7_9AGAR
MSGRQHTTEQPSNQAQMSEKKENGVGDAFMKGAAKEAGEQTVSYGAENGEESYNKAKAEAQGLWAKYCGCFGSA